MKHSELKKYLTKKKITQEEVANILGISRTAFVNKLSNKADFSISDIKALATFFNLSKKQVWQFFFEE